MKYAQVKLGHMFITATGELLQKDWDDEDVAYGHGGEEVDFSERQDEDVNISHAALVDAEYDDLVSQGAPSEIASDAAEGFQTSNDEATEQAQA